MKLKTEEISLQSGGIQSTQKFGIKNVGFILGILRSKLYKNPIEAICRELSANCLDAHKEIGKLDLPIEIVLPNSFKSEIAFRDCGIGIDPERMENIFLNYGESSKRQTNDQIGGFGLGAKTPFSYVDCFTIQTLSSDRIKRTYNAIIDESQEGRCLLMNSIAASENEPTGTTITIPVKREDYKAFTEAVIKFTKYWEVRPKLSGQTPIPEYPKMNCLLSGSSWKIFDQQSLFTNSHFDNLSGLIVVISGVPYEIDLTQLEYSNSTLDLRRLRELGLHLYVPNGELTIAASRDSLYFDPETKQKLKAIINVALSEIVDKLLEKINEFETYREACLFLQSSSASGSLLNQIDFLLIPTGKKLEWRGKQIRRTGFSTTDFGEYAKISTYDRAKNENGYELVKAPNLGLSSAVLLVHDNTLKSSIPSSALKKLFLENEDCTRIQVLFTPEKPNNADWKRQEELGKQKAPEYKTDLIQDLDFEKLTEALEGNFRRRENVKRVAGEKKIQVYEAFVKNGQTKLRPKKINPDEAKGYYIDLRARSSRGEYDYYLGENLFSQSYQQENLISSLRNFLDLKDNLYFLLPKTAPKVPNLVSIEELLKQKLALVDWNQVSEVNSFIAKKSQFRSLFQEFYSDSEEFEKSISYQIKDKNQNLLLNYFQKYKEFISQEEKFCQDINFFASICPTYLQSLGYTFENRGRQSLELDFLLDKIKSTYPMLFRSSLSNSNTRSTTISRYINLIDWTKSQTNIPVSI